MGYDTCNISQHIFGIYPATNELHQCSGQTRRKVATLTHGVSEKRQNTTTAAIEAVDIRHEGCKCQTRTTWYSVGVLFAGVDLL
jgi:hypothetical protein